VEPIMSKDITQILGGWQFEPENVSVRIVVGDDGREKIQLRLDLGLIQMEFDGRPDGTQVAEGCPTWLDYFQRKQLAHDAAHPDGVPFLLETEECAKLLREGVQYYHRYISFWHLERYELCARDTARNLKLFAFVRDHARHNKDKLMFDQWRPYVTMMHTRAVATPLVNLGDTETALGVIDAGVKAIERFLEEYHQKEHSESCAELTQLVRWREQVVAKRPGRAPHVEPQHPLVRLKKELHQAVVDERFEDAARLRDQIQAYSEPTMPGPPEGL
jgi:hypothetical protein